MPERQLNRRSSLGKISRATLAALLAIGSVLSLIPHECRAAASPSPTASAGQQTKESDSSAEKSYKDIPTASLQRQADKLADKRDALDDQNRKLADFLDSVRQTEAKLPSAPSASAQQAIDNVGGAFAALKAATPDTNVNSAVPNTPGAALVAALSQVRFEIVSPLIDAVSKVVPNVKPSLAIGPQRPIGALEQIANEAASDLYDNLRADFLTQSIPKLTELANSLYRAGPGGASAAELKRSAVEPQVVAATSEVEMRKKLLEAAFQDYRAFYKKGLDAVIARFEREIATTKTQIDEADKQLGLLNKVLQSRVQTTETRQSTLTYYSILTELLMISVIAFALVYLKRYPERLALTIVQERTIGDLLGMGLLLVTVVFLATGEFIERAAVVTLLGTIAGYISLADHLRRQRARPRHSHHNCQHRKIYSKRVLSGQARFRSAVIRLLALKLIAGTRLNHPALVARRHSSFTTKRPSRIRPLQA